MDPNDKVVPPLRDASSTGDTFAKQDVHKAQNAVEEILPFHTRCRKAVYSGGLGQTVDIVSTLISLLGCVLYIYETYFEQTEIEQWVLSDYTYPVKSFPTPIVVLEILISGAFLLDYLFFLYISDYRLHHMLSIMNIVDLVTIVPVVTLFQSVEQHSYLRFLRIFRALRFVRAVRIFRNIDDHLQRAILRLTFTIISFVFIGAGVLEYVGKEIWILSRSHPSIEQAYSVGMPFFFHDAVYFFLVTTTTVGYGDIYAVNTYARYLVVALILIGIVLIPTQAAEIADVWKAREQYRGRYRARKEDHVLLCGNISYANFMNFYKEFYNYNVENTSSRTLSDRIIILSEKAPESTMRDMLRRHRDLIKYYRGCPLNRRDLERVRLSESKAAFVLVNQYSTMPDDEDMVAMMYALAIKRASPDVKVHLQLCRAINLAHVRDAGIDHFISLTEFKLSTMAKSSLVKGASTFVNNLIRTEAPQIDADKSLWMTEYDYGRSQEIYMIHDYHESLVGAQFTWLVEGAYMQFGILVIGIIEHLDGDRGGDTSTVLFPSENTLSGTETIVAIAPSADAAFLLRGRTVDYVLKKKTEMSAQELGVVSAMGDKQPSVPSSDDESESCAQSPAAAETSQFDNDDLMSQEGATIATSVVKSHLQENTLDSAADLDRHIVVLGNPVDLEPLLVPLRASWISRPPPILIVDSEEPSSASWRSAVGQEGIYFLKGDPRRPETITDANVGAARAVIVLRGKLLKGGSTLLHDHRSPTVDAHALFTTFALRKRFGKRVQVLTEVVFPENLRFLVDPEPGQKKDLVPDHGNVCAGGQFWTSHTFDALLVQTLHTPGIMDVLSRLIVDGAISYGDNAPDRKRDTEREEHMQWFSDPCPAFLRNRSYGHALRTLLKCNCLLMGIYRSETVHGAPQSYVVTNPTSKFRIHAADRLYVLRRPGNSIARMPAKADAGRLSTILP